MTPDLPVAKILPKDVRDALVAASRIKPDHERHVAIDNAVQRARMRYPQYFKTEKSF